MGADRKIGRQLIIKGQGYNPKSLNKAGDIRQIICTQRSSLIKTSWFFMSGTSTGSMTQGKQELRLSFCLVNVIAEYKIREIKCTDFKGTTR